MKMLKHHNVPSYETNEFCPKMQKYCICVFVINEGDKLLSQIERMKGYCKDTVDIVIADGGSTDGSTEHERLKTLGVNTLLVKTGPGKLGSQMRMAFDWALKRGYEGVIVVDGNGKDGMDAIPRFAEELDKGVDHVQGSRFIKGGHHENTPKSRLLGLKLLHAPLIRLASGFKYTDTTNGFRAYSARLLSSEKLEIFRDCFSGYELHYYLAIEAARQGYRCSEIPVSRVYPAEGKTPTKISGFKGNVNIVKKLLLTCADAYSAMHPYKRLYWLSTFFVLAIIVFIVLMDVLSTLFLPNNFTPDSYSTYSLSKTFFSDFYRSPIIRSYSLKCPDILYSSSFPPLFPFLIALVNILLPIGIYAGIFINLLSLVGIFIMVRRIFDHTLDTGNTILVTSIVFLSFLNIIPILGSLTSGWSLLPSIFLQILTWYIVLNIKQNASCWKTICVSFLFGLGALNRFDWLLPSVFSVVMFPILFSSRKIIHLIISVVVFLLVISPWIIYSEAKFGVIWVSDNMQNAMSSEIISPWLFYLSDHLPGYPFYANITQWIKKIFVPLQSLIIVLTVFCLPFFVLIFAILLRPPKELKRNVSLLLKKEKRLLLSVAFILANHILCLGVVMLSGYDDIRYHAGMALVLFILVTILLSRAYHGFSFLSPQKSLLPYLLLICFAFTTLGNVGYACMRVRNGNLSQKVWNQEKNVQTKMEKYRCFLVAEGKTVKTYVSPSFEFSECEIGAFAGIPVFDHLPMSQDHGVFATGFYERVGIDYFLSPDDNNKEEFERFYELTPIKELPGLYQVRGKKTIQR